MSSETKKILRAETDKVLTCLEHWIESIVRDMGSDWIEDSVRRADLRKDVLDALSGTTEDE